MPSQLDSVCTRAQTPASGSGMPALTNAWVTTRCIVSNGMRFMFFLREGAMVDRGFDGTARRIRDERAGAAEIDGDALDATGKERGSPARP